MNIGVIVLRALLNLVARRIPLRPDMPAQAEDSGDSPARLREAHARGAFAFMKPYGAETPVPANRRRPISMPTSRSAKKRLRQDVVRRTRNRSLKSAVKTQIKKVHAALAEGDLERARSEFRVAQQQLDRAAARNMIHPNAAARLKSRLNARILSTQNADAKPKKRWSWRGRSRSKQAS